MSGNVFLDCVFVFLICYALVSIFYNVSDFLLHKYCKYPQSSFFLLELTHMSESFECDLRIAVSKSVKSRCALLISCCGLDDEEKSLLQQVVQSYNHIIITTPDEINSCIEMAKAINASL